MPQTLSKTPEVHHAFALDHGLTDAEYDAICDRLARTPTFTELGVYSVMGNEHCSYKTSAVLLKTLPAGGKQNAASSEAYLLAPHRAHSRPLAHAQNADP